MPRLPRIAFAGFPHHVYQRGHRQQQVFFCTADREDYLFTLSECRDALGMKVYAYCLMDNHVHLIIDPGGSGTNLSIAMKRLAGRHARRMNAMHGWRGSLWESRFKCSPIQSDRYLLTCGRYIDLNPVRAGMVDRPEQYLWSSYRSRIGIARCHWLDADPAIQALAPTHDRAARVYAELSSSPHNDQELGLIRSALHRNQLTGDEDFAKAFQEETGVLVINRSRGRPRKPDPETKQAPCGACLWGK